MEYITMEYITNGVIIITAFLLIYIFLTTHRRNNIINKSIQSQDQANQNLLLILNEIRRSNQFLAELVGIEDTEYPVAIIPEVASVGTTVNRVAAPTSTGPVPFIPSVSTGDPSLQAKVYVGNIDYAATEAELGEYFSQYGKVESVNIPVNRYTGKARGFGFVTFASQQEAEQAMVLNGSEFKGRQIQVNFAKERENS